MWGGGLSAIAEPLFVNHGTPTEQTHKRKNLPPYSSHKYTHITVTAHMCMYMCVSDINSVMICIMAGVGVLLQRRV